MEALGDLILYIHLFILIFVILVPFTNSQPLLLVNLALMGAIAFHWATNNTTCALTMLEKVLRGETDDTRTFFGRVMGPVYTTGKEKFTTQLGLFVLICLTLYKLDPEYVKQLIQETKESFSQSGKQSELVQ